MAFNYLATVTLNHNSGQAVDNVVNTFAFECDGALLSADADTLAARLEAFYNETGEGASHSIGSEIGGVISRVVKPICRFYNVGGHLDGSPAGSPVFIRTFANNLDINTDSQSLPSEVALCLSFHADFGLDVEFAPGTRPRSRDRGRVYIGPLTTAGLASGSGNRAKPAPGLINAIVGAGKDLRDANDDKRWSVWSRVAARMSEVTSCSVDDAFDIQRRRGERPLAKTTM